MEQKKSIINSEKKSPKEVELESHISAISREIRDNKVKIETYENDPIEAYEGIEYAKKLAELMSAELKGDDKEVKKIEEEAQEDAQSKIKAIEEVNKKLEKLMAKLEKELDQEKRDRKKGGNKGRDDDEEQDEQEASDDEQSQDQEKDRKDDSKEEDNETSPENKLKINVKKIENKQDVLGQWTKKVTDGEKSLQSAVYTQEK